MSDKPTIKREIPEQLPEKNHAKPTRLNQPPLLPPSPQQYVYDVNVLLEEEGEEPHYGDDVADYPDNDDESLADDDSDITQAYHLMGEEMESVMGLLDIHEVPVEDGTLTRRVGWLLERYNALRGGLRQAYTETDDPDVRDILANISRDASAS